MEVVACKNDIFSHYIMSVEKVCRSFRTIHDKLF